MNPNRTTPMGSKPLRAAPKGAKRAAGYEQRPIGLHHGYDRMARPCGNLPGSIPGCAVKPAPDPDPGMDPWLMIRC